MLKPSFKFQVVTESRTDIKETQRFIIVFIIFSKSKSLYSMFKPSFKFQVVTELRTDIKERQRFIIVFVIFSKSKEFVFNIQTLLQIPGSD